MPAAACQSMAILSGGDERLILSPTMLRRMYNKKTRPDYKDLAKYSDDHIIRLKTPLASLMSGHFSNDAKE